MYAVLGEIEFEVVTYWNGFENTMGVDYASHARIEGKPGVQFIGDKLEKISRMGMPAEKPKNSIINARRSKNAVNADFHPED